MELICIEDYTDTMYKLKAGESTSVFPDMPEDHKHSILQDYPHKFKVVEETKESSTEPDKKPSKKSKA